MHAQVFEPKWWKFVRLLWKCTTQQKTMKNSRKLSLIFLDGARGMKVSCRAPRAFRHAHWMTKTIYSIKMFFFQAAIHCSCLRTTQCAGAGTLCELCLTQVWYKASLPINTQLSDLLLMKELVKYQNTTVAKAASTAFSQHLWHFFSEILVSLPSLTRKLTWNWWWLKIFNFCRAPSLWNVSTVLVSLVVPVVLHLPSHRELLWSLTSSVWMENRRHSKDLSQRILKTGVMIHYTRISAALAVTVVNDSAVRAIALMQQ